MEILRADPAERRRRLSLQGRIHREYRTITTQEKFATVTLEFTRVADPDAVFDALEATARETGADARWCQPYWAAAWDSSSAVCELLARRDLSGVRVLDLGCGLGLTGAVTAARGARVTMADIATPALLFARLNTWPWSRQVQIRRLDWRTDRIAGPPFDLIVGSDILYDRSEWPHLDEFWRRHLTAKGQLLLGEPGRGTGDEFQVWLDARGGWRIACSHVRPMNANGKMRILRCATDG